MIAQEGGATVALVLYDDENQTTITTGYRPFCTGVWVDDTHILTANHCADAIREMEQEKLDARKEKLKEEPQTLEEMFKKMEQEANPEKDTVEERGLSIHYIVEKEVIDVGQEPSGWHVSKVVDFDAKHDLALLEAEGKLIPEHRVAKLAETSPEIGEKVYVVGQTIGLYWTYIEGNVAAYRGKDIVSDLTGPWMQVSAPVYFGNSGGGAFNEAGELIGIADWIKRAPEIAFFVHLDTIKDFLKDNHIGSKK